MALELVTMCGPSDSFALTRRGRVEDPGSPLVTGLMFFILWSLAVLFSAQICHIFGLLRCRKLILIAV